MLLNTVLVKVTLSFVSILLFSIKLRAEDDEYDKDHYKDLFKNKELFYFNGENTYSNAKRGEQTHLNYGLNSGQDPSNKRDRAENNDDCSYTFVVKQPSNSGCQRFDNTIERLRSWTHEELVKLEARMIARDVTTRKEVKNMKTRIMVDESGVQYMKNNMRVQSDEQVTLKKKYDDLKNHVFQLENTVQEVRKQLQFADSVRKQYKQAYKTAVSRLTALTTQQTKAKLQNNDIRKYTVANRVEQMTTPLQTRVTRNINEHHIEKNFTCDLPHRFHNDYCYTYMRKRKTWYEARKMCQNMGGNLVSIHSADEQTFVANFLRVLNAKKDGYWVYAGGHDLNKDSIWTWLPDNQTITEPTYWYNTAIPPPERGNLCMFLFLLDATKFSYWTRDKCHYRMPYICKIRMHSAY